MKHLFTAAALLLSMTAFAQVGINNTSPKATLDITAKTTDGSKPEGLIIPQLSGSNIHTATAAGVYGSNQKGLIIYATSADSSPISTTANITAAGYYYFDGTNWQKISTGNAVSTSLASGNIYVGSASNVATAVSPTGDVTISNTGATSIGAGKVTTTHLANNAVTVAKLPAGATATTFLRGDGTWVTPTDTNTTYTAGNGLTLTGTSFSANDATTGTKGIVQLAGDLAGTAASPTVAKIQNKAVSSTAPTNGQVLKYNTTTSAWEPAADTDTNTTYTAGSGLTLTGTSFSANDATATTKGIIQLAGDLAGPVAAPTITSGAVTSAKIADGAVTASKLNQMSATSGQVLGWNGTAWAPTAGDTTNDAWINDTTNSIVKLGTKADGTTRAAGTDFVAKDNGQVGIGTSSPDASAALEVASTNKGFLPPRVALNSKTDVTTISSPTAGLLVYNTGAGSLKSTGMYYWDGSQWTSLKGDGGTSSATDLNIGETRTAVITVPTSSFLVASTGINRTWMNGRAVNNTQNVNYKLLSDAAGSTNGFVNFGPNGALRMDFASGGYSGSFYAPKIINTSSLPIFYSLNALSTGDANMTLGAGMWLAAGAVCYQIDGNDGFNIITNSNSEYLNSNILIHNTTDGSVQFYIATWSMMSANDGAGHNNIYGLFTITRYK
ncbi:hypothetical protein SAMN05421846_10635 [Chryseobacterium taeanense]|uniref:Uncharacterized protein n=1 Tax=Chryseobacterium taeanense TaxID=311334 RepID=A0A1G8JE34_9FLAO|nr:hypothetical protein [Chryseobacterium taeanense]SDI29247.1 hypothetical protein SAMN05421846_10635 [Chryseobacterium taeanense]